MSIGIWQLVIILVIILLIFGAGKLPQVGGALGKGLRNFKSGVKDVEDELKDPEKLNDIDHDRDDDKD